MPICPVCGQRSTGKVGVDQYYCWECCVEFVTDESGTRVFSVEADGTLTDYHDPAYS